MVETKTATKSLTIQGAVVQVISSILIVLGIGDTDTITPLLESISLGVGAFLQLVGFVMTYVGRKRAKQPISLTGGKK